MPSVRFLALLPATLLVVGLTMAPAAAAVFQYAVPLAPAAESKAPSLAYLWIPPEARQIRGVIYSGMTLAEREMSQDPQIRRVCAEQQLAIVFLRSGVGSADIQQVLDDLAAASGYRELAHAPLLFFGHSAGGPPSKTLSIKMAERCFGVVQFRGGTPAGTQPSDTVAPSVPSLMMVGQFDEFAGRMRDETGWENGWESARLGLLRFRAIGDDRLGSVVAEPGAGHFAWSDRNAAYLALFIRKAAQARIPDWSADATEPVRCRTIDPAGGWLTDLTVKNFSLAEPAAWADYKGDRAKAAWHFDQEIAKANVAFHAGWGTKDQFIKWNDPYWVDAGARYFFTSIKWVDDGATFEVSPAYADAYPMPFRDSSQKILGPRWADAGKPVGHSQAAIQVKPVSGAVVPVGPTRLRFRFDTLAPAGEGGRVTFMAYSAGDEEYRHTEQVGMLPRGFKGLTKGRNQTITFPALGNLKADAAPVELKAVSDAGLKVEYYVAIGPASVADGKLKITDLPARPKFPITVKVVAWQFGSGIEPLVKTATPLEQTILIEKP